jgi:hypothetical protein
VAKTPYFANVDLEIVSGGHLQMLIDVFGERVMNLYHGLHEGEGQLATFELEIETAEETAEARILGFCELIESLPAAARAEWDRTSRRTLDIGVQGGLEYPPYATAIGPLTLAWMARLDVALAITVYPYREDPPLHPDEAE